MRDKYKHIEEQVLKLHNEGISPTEIRKIFEIPKSSYLHLRRKLNLESRAIRSSNISLDDYKMSVLIGTILGDASVSKGSTVSSNITFAHCAAQKEYFDYKVEIFKNMKGSIQEQNYYDKRTDKTYKRYCYTSLSFKEFKNVRDIFYKNNKKIIPIEYLKQYFTVVSLAVLYMDDGNTTKYSTTIATQCFSKENIEAFVKFLKNTFDLDFTIQSNNNIRIKQKDVVRFKQLVSKEISKIQCMKYKL